MSEIVGLITARGGSKSIPRKNIKLLGGKPLIAWTIEAAQQCSELDRVIVSTDDVEIAQVCREWGAEIPFMRPASLAQDDSSHISVVIHAIEWLAEHENSYPDYIMLLQPTAPLRSAEDMSATVAIARKHDAKAVVSVCESQNHPFLTFSIAEDGTLQNFVDPDPDIAYLQRQALQPAFALNGAIYLNRRTSLLTDRVFGPLGTYPYVMPAERSIDIDTPWEFYLTDLILRDRHCDD